MYRAILCPLYTVTYNNVHWSWMRVYEPQKVINSMLRCHSQMTTGQTYLSAFLTLNMALNDLSLESACEKERGNMYHCIVLPPTRGAWHTTPRWSTTLSWKPVSRTASLHPFSWGNTREGQDMWTTESPFYTAVSARSMWSTLLLRDMYATLLPGVDLRYTKTCPNWFNVFFQYL